MVPKVVVDCDAGTDDAVALIILIAAHKAKELEIIGVTCVGGNTYVDNVVCNVLKTLEICDTLEIPVYKGARTALLGTESSKKIHEDGYHGSDGLGDAFKDKPDLSKLQKEHAVVALNRMVTENPGEISLICLGPLTNIALAMKMFPEFSGSVKQLYVMGGNSTARGNITAQAEFNFYADPESVHIVLANVEKPLFLLPLETCLNCDVTQEWRVDVLGRKDTPIVKFINAIESGTCRRRQHSRYVPCDALLAGIVVRPEMKTVQEEFHADIELSGRHTRGQVVLDHLQSKKPNVQLILEYNSEIFKQVLLSAVEQP